MIQDKGNGNPKYLVAASQVLSPGDLRLMLYLRPTFRPLCIGRVLWEQKRNMFLPTLEDRRRGAQQPPPLTSTTTVSGVTESPDRTMTAY